MKNFLKQLVTAHTGISSKRVCGVLGFLVIIAVVLYCTLNDKQAPEIMESFIYAVCLLLGIDSVTGIFYKKNGGKVLE